MPLRSRDRRLALAAVLLLGAPGCILDLGGLSEPWDQGDDQASGDDASLGAEDDGSDGGAEDRDVSVEADDGSIDAPTEHAAGDATDADASDARGDGSLDAPGDGAAPDARPTCDALGGTDPGTGHCYFPIAPAKWTAARDACIAKGAHLVTITSASEQQVVASIYSVTDRWIGCYQVGTGAFQWVTKEPMAYKNFASTEPNNPPDACCRMISTSGLWFDEPCSQYKFTAICEREP